MKKLLLLALHWKKLTAINKQAAAIYNRVTCFGGSLQSLLLKLYKSTLLTYVGNINPVSCSKIRIQDWFLLIYSLSKLNKPIFYSKSSYFVKNTQAS